MAARIRIDENSKETDPVTAMWSDGVTWKVSNVLVSDYRLICAATAAAQKPKTLVWEGSTKEGVNLTLKWRNDRERLLIMFAKDKDNKKEKQVLQAANFMV
jgi:hypothetical protein